MDEYISRAGIIAEYDRQHQGPPGGARKIMETFPAADVRPVVLCQDCKYCLTVDEYERWCNGFCSPARLVCADDYCSHGERRNV